MQQRKRTLEEEGNGPAVDRPSPARRAAPLHAAPAATQGVLPEDEQANVLGALAASGRYGLVRSDDTYRRAFGLEPLGTRYVHALRAGAQPQPAARPPDDGGEELPAHEPLARFRSLESLQDFGEGPVAPPRIAGAAREAAPAPGAQLRAQLAHLEACARAGDRAAGALAAGLRGAAAAEGLYALIAPPAAPVRPPAPPAPAPARAHPHPGARSPAQQEAFEDSFFRAIGLVAALGYWEAVRLPQVCRELRFGFSGGGAAADLIRDGLERSGAAAALRAARAAAAARAAGAAGVEISAGAAGAAPAAGAPRAALRFAPGDTLLTSASRAGADALVAVLLEVGARARINRRNAAGETALVCACSGGHVPSVRRLIRAGAFVNACTFDGESSIHRARAGATVGHGLTYAILIRSGALYTSGRIAPLHRF